MSYMKVTSVKIAAVLDHYLLSTATCMLGVAVVFVVPQPEENQKIAK